MKISKIDLFESFCKELHKNKLPGHTKQAITIMRKNKSKSYYRGKLK